MKSLKVKISLTFNRDKVIKLIKIMMTLFLLNVVYRGIRFINIGMILIDVKSFGTFTYQLFDPVMNHSVIMRFARVGTDGVLNFYRIISSLTIFDVMIIVSALSAFELNRLTIRNHVLNQTFLSLIIVSLIAFFMISLVVIFTNSIETMMIGLSIVNLLCAGAYIGIAITDWFKIIRINEAS